MKKNVHIFLRKKTQTFNHSVERYAEMLSKVKSDKFNIKIINAPLESKGLFNRIILIFWAIFKQGDINHILGDIHFISLFMNEKKTINTFLDCRLANNFKGFKKFFYILLWFKMPIFRSKKITFISNFTKNEIFKLTNSNQKKNFSILPVPLFTKKNSVCVNKKLNHILIVGTQPNKNIGNILKALSFFKSIKIYIVGEINLKDLNFLRQKNINFENFTNLKDLEIEKLYNKCGLLLFASKYEGFGMPIIEAQSSKTLVITSNIEPLKTVSGKAAVLCNPNNIYDIKNKFIYLKKNKLLQNELIRKGIVNSNKYKINELGKKYKLMYEKFLENDSQKMYTL